MNHTKQFFLMLMLAIVSNVAAWGETYKLEQVTSVEAGSLYVFEQDGYVMNNTVSSSALQTTNTYNTSELIGNETYVWKLEKATNGFYMKNMDRDRSNMNCYLNNSSSTGVSFGEKASIWAFDFQTDRTVVIQNKSNSDRFLGYTSSTSHTYRAYATSNLDNSTYPHAIKVYKLVAEASAYTITPQSNNDAYGTVSLSGNTITATPAAGYQVSTTEPYTVTSGTATVAQNGNEFTVTTTEDCTVQINFEAIPVVTHLYIKADSAPYVYTWTGEGSSKTEHMGSRPGTQTTETEDVNGITWHKITVPAKGFNLILSKGKDQPQTENINNITEDKYIVWNSEADGYEATQTPTPYLFVGFGGVTAENKTVKVGNTTASSVTPEGFQLSYQSDNTNIATVSNDGTITGVSEGTATITVSWNTQEVGGQGYLAGSTTFTVTVTAAPSGDVFVKATSENDLQDGMQVIIVNDTYGNVMGEQSTNNFGVATVEIDKNTSPYKATPGEHATILTLEGSTGAWYFKDEQGKYLYAASSSSNYLRTQSESDKTNNAKATITISGDNSDAAIKFQGDHTHNIIMYNGSQSGAGLFSCYLSSSNQKPVQIYYRASQTLVARPSITPATGTYNEAQTVTITNNAEGATVYYTTDGTTPTTSSTVYSGPFTLSKSGTYEVKAIAVVDGNSSSVATSTITIQIYVEAPTISPEDGTQITEENSISISSASGLTIYYTTDGTDPVKNGELTGTAKAYNSAFTLTKAGTVKAVARDAGGNFSSIVSATYTYNGTATLPYYERFDEGLGNFISVNTGTVKWEFRQHTSQSFIDQYGEIRKYAYAANYDSKLHTYYSGTTRFVSPILDLTEEGLTNVMLNFIHAGAYFGSDENLKNRCKVQIITNVGGKDLSSTAVLSTDGNWTDIEVPTDGWFDYSDGKFTRKNSGDIDLSSYVGKKVRIGFWYNAGEIDYTHHGTWNVDQISIRGELVEKVNIAKPSTSPETETEGYTTYVTKNDIDAATTLTGKGVKLYKVVEFDKRNVVLVQLGLGEEGEGAIGENTYSETMVPAGSPVLVKGEFGERELVLVNSSEVIPKLRGNLLRSAMEGVTATENDHFFVLQYPKAVGAYGFHLLSTGRSFDGRRAYLNGVDEVETLTTQTNSAKGVFLFGEEEDVLPLSIQQLDVHASSVTYSDGIYDLMGRKVNTSNGHLPKGIYVVKGKKFVVK